MEAFGAEVIIVEQAEGAVDGQVSGEDLELVEEQAAEIVSRRGASASISSAAKATSWPMSGTRGPSSGHNPRDRLTSSWTRSEPAARSPGWPGLCAASTPRSERTPSNRPAPRSWAEGCVSNPRHRIQGAGYARTDLGLFDKTIAFLACDSGLKYLSTDLFP